MLAGAGAVPVLGAARRGQPQRHTKCRRRVPGPDRRAVGARQRVGQYHGTACPPDPAQDICHRRQNRQGQCHSINS